MTKVNTLQIVENIYTLAKQRQIMIKDLEQAAGVSVGYLSKMNKPDARLPLEVVSSIAGDFGMTVDALIHYDPTGLTNQEKKIVKLFEKLTNDTNADKLEWKIYLRDFYELAYDENEKNAKERDGLPPFTVIDSVKTEMDPQKKYYRFIHKSCFANFRTSGNVTTEPINCFVAKIDENVAVQIVYVRYTIHDVVLDNKLPVQQVFDGYEMYFDKEGSRIKVCQATADEYPTYLECFEKLFRAIKEYDARGKLDKNANNIIDGYLSTDSTNSETY